LRVPRPRRPEHDLILAALAGPRPGAGVALRAADEGVESWDEVARLCKAHRIAPWVVAALGDENAAVPEPALKELRVQAAGAALAQLLLTNALEEALLALEGAGIPVVVLKGPYVASRFYPEPALRPYSDVDIMVRPEHQAAVGEVCAKLGYVVEEDHGGEDAAHPGTSESQFETLYIHRDSRLKLDVHYDHLQLGLRPRDLDGFWRRCRAWPFLRAHPLVPSDGDLFIALAVHLHRHGFNRLLWLKDLDLMIRGADLDWAWLRATAKAEGVSASFKYCLVLAQRLLATPLPSEAARWAASGSGLPFRLLWQDEDIVAANRRSNRWRRAVQYVPEDGLRGILPSLAFMGRRFDKIRALRRRVGATLTR
jgi:hypothetical protein